MIIEIDGYFHQSLLSGKECSKQELKQMYLQAQELSYDQSDLPDVFCRIHYFIPLSYTSNIKRDFVIDTDTGLIYRPHY